MSKKDLLQYKDLTKEEALAQMKSGKLTPPKDRQERSDFLKLLDMDKAKREEFLADVMPAPVVIPVADLKGAVQPSASPELKEKKEETPIPVEQKKEWWKELGYESETKALEAHKTLRELTEKQQTTLDGINAKEGKRGQELQRLLKENERLLAEMGKLKPAPAKVEKPVRPKKPDPTKFENGAFDEKYTVELTKYEQAMDQYNDQFESWVHADAVAKAKSVMTELVPSASSQQPSNDAPWNSLFQNDIPEFQKRHNLVTTVPVKRISDSLIAADPDTKSSPQEKALAKAFLDSVPKTDMDNYYKVKQAVEIAYDFSSGVPISKYKTIEGALFDNDLIGDGKQFNVVKPVHLSAAEETAARERARQQTEQTATTVPASAMAGADPQLSKAQSPDEKKKRYRDLLSQYNLALIAGKEASSKWEKTEAFKEMVTLRKELTGKVASYMEG